MMADNPFESPQESLEPSEEGRLLPAARRRRLFGALLLVLAFPFGLISLFMTTCSVIAIGFSVVDNGRRGPDEFMGIFVVVLAVGSLLGFAGYVLVLKGMAIRREARNSLTKSKHPADPPSVGPDV